MILSEYVVTCHPQLTVYNAIALARDVNDAGAHAYLEGEGMIYGFLAVEQDSPMHTGREPFTTIDRNDQRTILLLAELEPKLEYSFTDPPYREISMEYTWIRYVSATHFPFTEFAFSSAVG